MYVALDAGYLERAEFEDLKCKAEEVSKLLAGFARWVKHSPHSGVQYKREKTRRDLEIEEIMEAGRRAQEEAIRRSKEEGEKV